MRSLCLLPGGLGRFVPCSIGANHCRLRHLGWERCCHGLTSRPRESAFGPFFWTSFYLSFIILLGHLLPYLMVLFLCGIVLSSMLLRLLFGFCLFLVTFLCCLLFMIRLLLVVFRLLVMVLDLEESDFD